MCAGLPARPAAESGHDRRGTSGGGRLANYRRCHGSAAGTGGSSALGGVVRVAGEVAQRSGNERGQLTEVQGRSRLGPGRASRAASGEELANVENDDDLVEFVGFDFEAADLRSGELPA